VSTPVSGLWYEDLAVGLLVHHPVRRTITETDNVLFTTMTMNPAPIHLDHEYAAGTEFGRPLVNSMFTLALVVGISVHGLTMGTIVANLGFDEVTFPSPLFHGDTIGVETEIAGLRESASRPSQGIVTLEHRGFCRDTIVCRAVRTVLWHRRPTA